MSYQDSLDAVGFKGKPLAHIMTWVNDGNVHRVSSYSSADPSTIGKQIQLAQACGFKGFVATWQGPQHHFSHQATLQLCLACNMAGMLFGLLLDPAVKNTNTWASDPGFLEMVNSPMYLPEKFLLDMDGITASTGGALPPGLTVLKNQQGFGWPNPYDGDNARSLTELQNTNKLATMMMPAICDSFFDGGFPLPSGVTPAQFAGSRQYEQNEFDSTKVRRCIDHQAGKFFFQTVAALKLCPNAPYVCMVTFNDHDETTGGREAVLAAFLNIQLGNWNL